MALAHFTRTIHYIQFISLFCSNRTKHRARGGVEQIICRFADPQDTGMKAIKNTCVFYSSNNNQQSNSCEKYRLQHIPNKQGWESISRRWESRVDSHQEVSTPHSEPFSVQQSVSIGVSQTKGSSHLNSRK